MNGRSHTWYTQTMPNKTIYIRKSDVPLWEKADSIAYANHQALAQLLMEALRNYLATVSLQEKRS